MPRGLPFRALPLFFFLHVPKVAGMSLQAGFKGMFGQSAKRGGLFRHIAPDELRAAAKTERKPWDQPGFYTLSA